MVFLLCSFDRSFAFPALGVVILMLLGAWKEEFPVNTALKSSFTLHEYRLRAQVDLNDPRWQGIDPNRFTMLAEGLTAEALPLTGLNSVTLGLLYCEVCPATEEVLEAMDVVGSPPDRAHAELFAEHMKDLDRPVDAILSGGSQPTRLAYMTLIRGVKPSLHWHFRVDSFMGGIYFLVVLDEAKLRQAA